MPVENDGVESTDVDELDSNNDDTDTDAGGGDDEDPKVALQKALDRIAALEGKTKDVVGSRNKVKDENRQLKEQLAKYEAKEREEKMKRARAAQDFSVVEKTYQEREKTFLDRIAELEKSIADGRKAQARGTIIEEVVRSTNIDRDLVDAFLFKAESQGLFDVPEEVSEDVVESASARIRALIPKKYTQRATGGAQGAAPGLNLQTKPEDERPVDKNDPEYWTKLAQKRSRARQKK